MSLHGQTKGTKFEKLSEAMALGEAHGVMMYYALARLAKEQGLEDVAAEFIEAANQEAVHAGFYAVLNGKYPQDFWHMVRSLAAAESAGDSKIMGYADSFRAEGLNDAADILELFAKQEGHHGVMLRALLQKYHPELLAENGGKVYVCAVCGFEYVGDLDAEPDSYACPLCGQPKRVFRPREK